MFLRFHRFAVRVELLLPGLCLGLWACPGEISMDTGHDASVEARAIAEAGAMDAPNHEASTRDVEKGDSAGDDASQCPGGWSASSSGTTNDLTGVWASGPSDVWAVGNAPGGGAILHWNGTAWFGTALPSLDGGAYSLLGVWGSGASDIWAVGAARNGGAILHWDGTAWLGTTLPLIDGSAYSLLSVWGSGPSDVWAVGYACTSVAPDTGAFAVIWHWDGGGWSASIPLPPEPTIGLVWGSGPNDVWASAGGYGISHWNGAAWSAFPLPVGIGVDAFWGTGPNDVWGIGNGILHWNGVAWSVSTSELGARAAWGSGPNDVWAVGSGILHWDGGAWSISCLPTKDSLTGVWGSGPGDVWAVGYNGTILHHS
jgi:hypothetical protein